jgi:hypothetical protein
MNLNRTAPARIRLSSCNVDIVLPKASGERNSNFILQEDIVCQKRFLAMLIVSLFDASIRTALDFQIGRKVARLTWLSSLSKVVSRSS